MRARNQSQIAARWVAKQRQDIGVDLRLTPEDEARRKTGLPVDPFAGRRYPLVERLDPLSLVCLAEMGQMTVMDLISRRGCVV